MRMKRLIKFGALLLFMIGFCIVQTGYSTPVLVDDDVGVEFVTSVSIADDVIFTESFVITQEVAMPLKYLVIASETDIISNRNSEVWKEFTIDCVMPIQALTIIQDKTNSSEISSTNLISEKQTGKRLANINEGLYRLDIGENF